MTHDQGHGAMQKAPYWVGWRWLRTNGVLAISLEQQKNADTFVFLFSANRSCVSADTNMKCLVHLKHLLLSYMKKAESLSLCWKHCQTNCQCAVVADILLPWQAATLAIHMAAWLPHRCVLVCVFRNGIPLCGDHHCGSRGRWKDAFFFWRLLGEVGPNLLLSIWSFLYSPADCSCVWFHFFFKVQVWKITISWLKLWICMAVSIFLQEFLEVCRWKLLGKKHEPLPEGPYYYAFHF